MTLPAPADQEIDIEGFHYAGSAYLLVCWFSQLEAQNPNPIN